MSAPAPVVDLAAAAAVAAASRSPRRVEPPLPVLACRCGAGMTWDEMRRPAVLRPNRAGNAARIEPIVCPDCARRGGYR